MSDKNIENQLRRAKIELKRRISLLERALQEKREAVDALQDSEKRYRRLFESARDGILILDANSGEVIDVNPFMMELLGYDYDDFRRKHLWEIGPFKDVSASKIAFKTLRDNKYIRYEDLPLETADGRIVEVEFVSNVYLVDHAHVIQCNIRDITERRQADAERERSVAALQDSEVRYRALFEASVDGILISDKETSGFRYANPAICRFLGYSEQELTAMSVADIHPETDLPRVMADMEAQLKGVKTLALEIPCRRKDGSIVFADVNSAPLTLEGRACLLGFFRDISERKRVEAERDKIQAQFNQAQKMESVGRLAGGVAHDYNNMLSVILGNTELAMDKVDSSVPLHADLNEIFKAAKRSTEITRQLLAFARKQTISPKVIDVNQTVEGMLKMLRHLIGEGIDLALLPEEGLWPIKIDPGQVDQILANLCINARDAIAGVGRITIETHTVTFDAAYCADHAGFIPGDFVLLSVSDDGCGMDKETLDSIFEPFFTTKAVNEGTGLGLATVFGIVKQNNGFINVYSEPGEGTTFRIYFSRHVSEAEKVRAETVSEIPSGKGETVLLVEDEPAIIKLCQMMLERLGYQVLTTGKPSEALRLAGNHADEIHLLITDVVMPEMNGRELADQLCALFPDIKILFMSGYTANVIAHSGVLEEGVNFIQKPFSIKELAVKVFEVLGGE